jgi:hypothetical protein
LPDPLTVEVPPKPLLLFVHIPKTAGTTLTSILRLTESPPRTRSIGNVFKGFGGFDKGPLDRLRDPQRAPDLSAVRILRGHLPLGVRDLLPKDRTVRCFTFLRDPVERTLSHYFQIRASPERAHGLPTFPENGTLEHAFEVGYLHDNLQTRMLCGLAEPMGDVTEEMLERAKRHLAEELVLVGLAERFDESLVLAQQRLGLRNILYTSAKRVNESRPRADDVPEALVRAAERLNQYDRELYRFAVELFDRSPELGQLEFAVGLAALRAARSGGRIRVTDPVPQGFAGTSRRLPLGRRRSDPVVAAWRMLVESRASAMRLQAELQRIRQAEAQMDASAEDLQRELAAAHARTKDLEEELRVVKSVDKARVKRASAAARAGKASPSEDAEALVEQLEAIVDARELASEHLERLRDRIAELEAAVAENDVEAGADDPNGAQAKAVLRELRRRARAAKGRIETLDQRKAGVERTLAALTAEATPK